MAPGERVASRHFVLLRLAKLAEVVALAWGAGCLMLRGRMGFPRGMILDWLRDLINTSMRSFFVADYWECLRRWSDLEGSRV